MEQTIPKLVHLEEFKKLLTNYEVSEASKEVLKKTQFVQLMGPTASGRNTIIDELLETGHYFYLVSDTTRPPRMHDGRLEQNGKAYFFRTEEEVLQDLRDGKYVEAALIHNQQISGTSIRELARAAKLEKIGITEVQIDGIENVHKAKPDTISIFVVPPGFEEWQRRLMHRGFMTPEETKRRMNTALVEFEHALEHDYYHFVINDTVDNAAIRINQIARFGDKDNIYKEQAHRLVEQLYAETKAFIASM